MFPGLEDAVSQHIAASIGPELLLYTTAAIAIYVVAYSAIAYCILRWLGVFPRRPKGKVSGTTPPEHNRAT
jgi:hypothetical protein